MSLLLDAHARYEDSFPRTRGDEPCERAARRNEWEFSPHTRG